MSGTIETENSSALAQSTTIDNGADDARAVGAGIPPAGQTDDKPDQQSKPVSRRDAIEASAKKLEAAENERLEKDPPEAERRDAGKDASQRPEKEGQGAESRLPEKDDTSAGSEAGKSAQEAGEEGQKRVQAPARFMPKAQEVWHNTPNAVKQEVARLEREYEDTAREGLENRQFRQSLSQYEEMAQKSGISLDTALERYTSIEGLLRQNPVQGVAEVLKNIGMTPQQYAQIVMQNSPQYQAMMMAQRQVAHEQPQSPPEVVALQRQLAEERMQRAHAEIITPFAAKHPDFVALQNDVAFFLGSGKIPNNMPPSDRLEAAYDMAVRLNGRSIQAQPQNDGADVAQTANPRAGTASVKGAPSAGVSAIPARRGKVSRREAIARAAELADTRD